MLYEIYCDLFGEKIDGKFIPRGRIKFRPGLNTILGDKKAENSIGKSTFLLVVDLVVVTTLIATSQKMTWLAL